MAFTKPTKTTEKPAKRPRGNRGGGRKPGTGTLRKSSKAALKAAEQYVSPVAVMLDTMETLWKAGRKVEASDIASKVAPYVTPRLSSVQHRGLEEVLQRLTDAELRRQIEILAATSGLVGLFEGSEPSEEDGEAQGLSAVH